ncbi:two-component hybrid sensor and regulator [Minicystis rosea]|nr:two-component hybrid sensor and regulator [Minicystis rosea]
MPKEPILVVDDNPANLELARVLLQSAGYEVRGAADAEQALGVLESFRPRLILMDIQLPGMDGLTLTRRLKADPATRSIRIVALIAYAMKSDEARARAAGCDGYISKPIDSEILLRQIAELLSPASASAPAVLLVEDNAITRKLFRIALETEGYRVVEAPDGATALAHVRREMPALALLDVVLPDMNGVDLARALRQLPGGEELPLVAVSGFPGIVAEPNALPAGFDAVVIKPVDPQRLCEVVRAYVPEAQIAARSGEGRHILIADDDPAQLKLTILHFRQAGFVVTGAPNGKVALELAEASRPDLILSDVLMPELDGFALCLAVRRDPRLASVPVVLASAHYRENEDDALAQRVGANAFVVRTPDVQELVRLTLRHLAQKAAPPPISETDTLEAAHARRLVLQLERQAIMNAGMARRCALQAAQLSILGGIADALAKSDDIERAIDEILASCLDAGGVSKGALYRVNQSGALVLHTAIGFSELDRDGLKNAFGYGHLLDQVVSGGIAISIHPTSGGAPEAVSLLPRLGVVSALIVPLVANGRRVGALLLGSNAAEAATEDLLGFARTMGAYIGQAMALAMAFERVNVSEKRYRALTEYASDAILVTTLEGLILEVNLRAEQLFGRPSADLVGRSFRELFEADHILSREQGPAIHGDARLADVEVVRPDGERVLADWSAALVRTNDESLVLLIGRDITERKRNEAMLRRRDAERLELLAREQEARREAERASRAKDEFLSTLSHELRTPLTAILGWATMLRTKKSDADWLDRAIGTIERNARAQARLIDDLFDVARIDAGKIRIEAKPISVVPLIQAGLDAIAPVADAKGVRVESDLDPAVGTLWGDPSRVQQVVWNLLANGVKFTPRGGVVRVVLARRGGSMEIVVSDTGQGIDASFLPHVFDRFRQADSSNTRTHGGLGLGLSIARQLVEMHGGHIRAASEGPGRGATFTVSLPIHAVPRPAPPDAPPESSTLDDSRLHTRAPRLEGLRVLAVEDDDDTREMLALVLQDAGADVTTVASAAEALDALARTAPDVLVSDISMPGMDGYELIRAVRGSPASRAAASPPWRSPPAPATKIAATPSPPASKPTPASRWIPVSSWPWWPASRGARAGKRSTGDGASRDPWGEVDRPFASRTLDGSVHLEPRRLPLATHLREDTAAQTAADLCAAIASALDSDPTTKPLAPLWEQLTGKGDALAAERRTLERAAQRARALLAVTDGVWDPEVAAFGRDLLDQSGGRRDAVPYTRFFVGASPSEVQDFGIEREIAQGRLWIRELGRDPAEALSVKWTPRFNGATDALEKASKDRVERLTALAVHGTGEVLYIESVNLEIDRLEGELKKLFPGQPERVASFLAATKPRRKKKDDDDTAGGP